MDGVDETVILRRNLTTLSSPKVREVACSESVGGNAGPGCYAVNLEVDEEGTILSVGNDPVRTNAAVRIFTSAFFRGVRHHRELAMEVTSAPGERARRRLTLSVWLWNLRLNETETDLLVRFERGDLDWAGLMELLRTRYPELIRVLTAQRKEKET